MGSETSAITKKLHTSSVVNFKQIKVSNPDYVDPGDACLPRPPSVLCRNPEQDPEFQSYKRAELSKKRRDYSAYTSGMVSAAELLDSFEKSAST